MPRDHDEIRKRAEAARAAHAQRRRSAEPTEPIAQPLTDEQAETIARALNGNDVHYVVMGGLASQLRGVPVPRTMDADVVVDQAAENLDRLCSALRELGARLRVQGGPAEGVEVGIDPTLFDRMVTTTFVTDAGHLDVMFRPDGTHGYHDVVVNADRLAIGSEHLEVADLADVIRSKVAAGRVKDQLTLPTLEAHQRRTRSADDDLGLDLGF